MLPARLMIAATFLLVAATASAQTSLPDPIRFFGRLHPVLLHLPIGLMMGVALLELMAMARRSEVLRPAIKFLLPLAVLLSLATAIFGLILSWEGGYDSALITWHQYTGFAVAGFGLLALALTRAHEKRSAASLMHGYRASLFASVVSIIIAGHFGGTITHGKGYILEYMPFFNRAAAPGELNATPAARQEYHDIVQPILAQHCYGCHGPDRQRGGLRLDDKSAALEGGKSGMPAIEPGDLLSSTLAERILLPRDDEAAMPPPSREGLTPEQTLALVHWIQRGADWPEE